MAKQLAQRFRCGFFYFYFLSRLQYRGMKQLYQRVSILNEYEEAIDEGFFGFFFYLGEKKKRPAGEAIEKKKIN
ncbi:MAG: hypothetical protein WC606_03110 [Candidatus Absconditabacterales bacterium]